jgi:hypothetical protein
MKAWVIPFMLILQSQQNEIEDLVCLLISIVVFAQLSFFSVVLGLFNTFSDVLLPLPFVPMQCSAWLLYPALLSLGF